MHHCRSVLGLVCTPHAWLADHPVSRRTAGRRGVWGGAAGLSRDVKYLQHKQGPHRPGPANLAEATVGTVNGRDL